MAQRDDKKLNLSFVLSRSIASRVPPIDALRYFLRDHQLGDLEPQAMSLRSERLLLYLQRACGVYPKSSTLKWLHLSIDSRLEELTKEESIEGGVR